MTNLPHTYESVDRSTKRSILASYDNEAPPNEAKAERAQPTVANTIQKPLKKTSITGPKEVFPQLSAASQQQAQGLVKEFGTLYDLTKMQVTALCC